MGVYKLVIAGSSQSVTVVGQSLSDVVKLLNTGATSTFKTVNNRDVVVFNVHIAAVLDMTEQPEAKTHPSNNRSAVNPRAATRRNSRG